MVKLDKIYQMHHTACTLWLLSSLGLWKPKGSGPKMTSVLWTQISSDIFPVIQTSVWVVLLCHVAWNLLKFLNAYKKSIATPRQVLKILPHKRVQSCLEMHYQHFPPFEHILITPCFNRFNAVSNCLRKRFSFGSGTDWNINSVQKKIFLRHSVLHKFLETSICDFGTVRSQTASAYNGKYTRVQTCRCKYQVMENCYHLFHWICIKSFCCIYFFIPISERKSCFFFFGVNNVLKTCRKASRMREEIKVMVGERTGCEMQPVNTRQLNYFHSNRSTEK